MNFTLSELKTGETAIINNVTTDELFKKRLFDIGVIKGSVVKVLHSSPCGDPRAYLIKGCVIALRNCDAQKISVIKRGENCG